MPMFSLQPEPGRSWRASVGAIGLSARYTMYQLLRARGDAVGGVGFELVDQCLAETKLHAPPEIAVGEDNALSTNNSTVMITALSVEDTTANVML